MLAKPTQYVFRLAYINHFIGFIDQEVNERLAIGHIEGISFKFARKHYACKRPTRDETHSRIGVERQSALLFWRRSEARRYNVLSRAEARLARQWLATRYWFD